jgi:esterase
MRVDTREIERITSGDVEIAFRRFGSPGRTPILIAHGLSYFSYDWIGPGSRLATNREVGAMDMRGFGASTWSFTRDYKLETLSSDAVAVMDALGWRQAVLLGHSFGGRIALATAGWKPERAAAVVLVDFAPDIAPAGRRHTAERIGGQPDLFGSVDEALAYHGHAEVGSALRARYEAFLERRDGGYRLRRDLAFRDNFRRALETGQSAPVPPYLWTMLAELTVPTLVIRGSDSDMFAPETIDKVKAANPRARTMEIVAGHDIAGDNPDALVTAVRGFLDENGL